MRLLLQRCVCFYLIETILKPWQLPNDNFDMYFLTVDAANWDCISHLPVSKKDDTGIKGLFKLSV